MSTMPKTDQPAGVAALKAGYGLARVLRRTVLFLLFAVSLRLSAVSPAVNQTVSAADRSEEGPGNGFGLHLQLSRWRHRSGLESHSGRLARLYYDLGFLLQSEGDWERAEEAYLVVLSGSEVDQSLQALSLWNLGVIDHLHGRRIMNRSPRTALERLESARQRYIGAMLVFGSCPELAGNYEVLLREQDLLQRLLARAEPDLPAQAWFQPGADPDLEAGDNWFEVTVEISSLTDPESDYETEIAGTDGEPEAGEGKTERPPSLRVANAIEERVIDEQEPAAEIDAAEILDLARRREQDFRQAVKKQFFHNRQEPGHPW